MTQALQLLTVVAVGFGLGCYGLAKGRKERQAGQPQTDVDPRQQSLFPKPDPKHSPELVTR